MNCNTCFIGYRILLENVASKAWMLLFICVLNCRLSFTDLVGLLLFSARSSQLH